MDRQPLNEQEEQARRQLALLLGQVLEGQRSYVEAAPLILSLKSSLGGVKDFDEDFMAFVAISSETDRFPTQATRHLWSERAVRELEQEIAQYEKWAEARGAKSCAALLARFG